MKKPTWQRHLRRQAALKVRTEYILNVLRQLVAPGDTVELRAIPLKKDPLRAGSQPADSISGANGGCDEERVFNRSYHYDKLPTMAARAAEFDGTRNVYFSINPVWSELAGTNLASNSAMIERRRYLYIDVDPERWATDESGSQNKLTSEWCSTAAEKQTARELLERTRAYLDEQRWPEPAFVNSGNGWALLYRIDVPTDDNHLVKRCLHALKQICETPELRAHIDPPVSDANRHTKIPGTLNCKLVGPERPRRRSALVSVPDPWLLVPTEQLEALASLVPPPPLRRRSATLEAPAAYSRCLLNDKAIIKKASNAKNRQKFLALWKGDISGYESQSSADIALLSILAFWTNRDQVAMDRLFRQSGLYRDKWEREDYRERTIAATIANCHAAYAGKSVQQIKREQADANPDAWVDAWIAHRGDV
jgi:hypothetical protein